MADIRQVFRLTSMSVCARRFLAHCLVRSMPRVKIGTRCTSAPPMDEAVWCRSGILIPSTASTPCNLGELHTIDSQALFAALSSFSLSQIQEMGACASEEFWEMDRAF